MSDRKPECCGGCRYFTEDRGVWTCTGWTGRGSGFCNVEPKRQGRHKNDAACRHAEPDTGPGRRERA